MAIDIELAGLKAAGTYRFERDLSAVSSGNTTDGVSNLRLIVGFSKKGPFNSVQLISNASEFIKVYGNIDRALEKKGSYFHRSALVALSAGPVLCLNLLTLDPDRDQIMHRSISANVSKQNKNIITLPYQTVFNTDKFWYINSESYLDSVHTFDNAYDDNGSNNILNFTNVGNKPISILVRKASEKNTKGYNVTLNEWYGEDNVPEYLNGSSFISDYMVEVYIIGGNFGPELTKATRPVGSSSGDDNANLYIYTDECLNVFNGENINPYKRFASDVIYQEYFDKYGLKADKFNKFLELSSVNVIGTYIGSLIPNFVNKLNQNMWIEDMINKDTMVTGLLCSEDVDMIENVTIDEDGMVKEKIDIIGHNLHNLNSTERYVNFLSYGLSEERMLNIIGANSDNDILTYIGEIEICGKSGFYINDKGVILNPDADNEVVIKKPNSEFDKGINIKVGDMLLSHIGIDEHGQEVTRLTRVSEIKPLYSLRDGEYVRNENHIRVICFDKIEKTNPYDSVNGEFDNTKEVITKYSSIDEVCDRYHWTYLGGFKVNDKSMPNGENERQNEILDMISEYNKSSNLYNALIDRDAIQWRYVVDTFGNGIEGECKKVYTRLCKGRQSGFAIVNAPSIKDFKKSTEPSFIDEYGAIKSEYIATGGNLDETPNTIFTLPKEENGASWGAYFYPYLKISDLATVKTVPPAAYVSNLFISKYGSSKPWAIVAGPKRGVISGNQVIGVEGSLVHNDREYLEPMGINPIVWENGVGVEIFANKTAKQSPLSSLSSIHAREVCIYIQDNVEAILKRYNWEVNSARNREEIKSAVDSFLLTVKDGEGIYDFKTVMDTTNNTSEVIDRNMGIIDIYIEVVKGLEILAQRLTVLKSGSIESGDFE